MAETLKVSDVCEALNCSRTTVYRRVKDGTLKPAFMVGKGFRFTPEEIERFKFEHKHPNDKLLIVE